MDDTRRKAEDLIRFKSEKEEYERRRTSAMEASLQRAKQLITQTCEGRQLMKQSKEQWQQQNQKVVVQMRKEQKMHRKQRSMINREYLKQIQQKKFHDSILSEAFRIKNAQDQRQKFKSLHEYDKKTLVKETKLISKQKKQQKKLQELELIILESLKNTYAKQQNEIEKIHDIMTTKSLDQEVRNIVQANYPNSLEENETTQNTFPE